MTVLLGSERKEEKWPGRGKIPCPMVAIPVVGTAVLVEAWPRDELLKVADDRIFVAGAGLK